MKPFRIAAAMLGASLMLSLTGCGMPVNYAARYDDYFRYCFGEDYTFTSCGMSGGEGGTEKYRVFRLEYHDKNGNLRVNDNVVSCLYRNQNKEYYPTKELFYQSEVEDLVFGEIEDIVKEEFYENFVSQYFDCSMKADSKDSFEIDGGEATGLFVFLVPVYLPASQEPDRSVALQHIKPGTGLQACSADLKSVMQDDQWEMIFTVNVKKNADAEKYAQQAEKMRRALEEYTETPQNYSFVVRQYLYDDGENFKTDTQYQYTSVMGETVDAAAMLAEDIDYNVMRDTRDRIIEKYGNAQ